jgi:hypothetical protein
MDEMQAKKDESRCFKEKDGPFIDRPIGQGDDEQNQSQTPEDDVLDNHRSYSTKKGKKKAGDFILLLSLFFASV